MQKDDLRNLINENLKEFSGVIWGACDISNTEFYDRYKNAIIIIIPFREMLTLEGYKEPYFREIQYETFPIRDSIEEKLSKAFNKADINHHVVTLPNLEKTLHAEFSTKEAARRAGLGWIGKNGLLVTEQYGPRLSMSGILIDSDIETGIPVEESSCGSCDLCVKACLFQTLSGVAWTKQVTNADIVDYRRCHEMRNRAKQTKLGRKLACGKCIVSCPYGTTNL